MFFQLGLPSGVELSLIITAASLIIFDMLLLKIGLAITKAQVKKNMKWVAGSWAIQFGVIFLISSPIFLYAMIGRFHGEESIIIPVVIFSLFIDTNIINLIHRVGIKRSIVVVLFVVGPLISAMYMLGNIFSRGF